MDYNSLTAQIQAYANRTDNFFISQIPNLINQGITRIYNEAKNIGFQQVTNGLAFTAGQNTINKPLNWKETISLQYTGANGVNTFLFPRVYEFCINYWPTPAAQGTPIFYADYNLPAQNVAPGQFYIVPTPDRNYPYTLTYLGLPEFDGGHPTNFLTDRFPDLLLYSCMLEAIPFLKDDERVPVFTSFYDRALQAINRETTQRYTDRTSKRDKD